MVGSALIRALDGCGATLLRISHNDLDLRRQAETEEWIGFSNPDIIILAAATVGGIEANRTRPGEFIYDNMMIAANVVHAAAATGVEKLLYLGSSCIYPKLAEQPITEKSLLTGALEPTNEAYAIAKIAGIKLCQFYKRQYGHNFISAMPCNLYGPGDTYDVKASHVIPALIIKFCDAAEKNTPSVTLWGTGSPLREFLHVDDLASGLLTMVEKYDGEGHLNIGSGHEVSIADLAMMIAKLCGYGGKIVFDPSMPDGALRKMMDSDKIRALGWVPSTSLESGLKQVIEAYRKTKIGVRNAA